MKQSTKAIGDEGERLAAEYLESKGYEIVERNYRSKVGEIDLIVTKGFLLVFCEVKSRYSFLFGQPAEAVNKEKIRHIRFTASRYLTQNMRIKHIYDDFDIRFDVLEMIFVSGAGGYELEINHLENVF